MRMNMNALALPAALLAGAAGTAAMEAPDADAASLNAFGPAYSHNLNTANQELDQRLSEEGPNGCTAEAIAEVAGITTAAGRAKYITAGNVNFKDVRNVTNLEYPTNTGATADCTPVKIPDLHSSSVAADLEFKQLPKSSMGRAVRTSNGELEPIDGVIRLDCGGNALLNNNRPKTHQRINEKHTSVNVSFGVKNLVAAFAASEAASVSSSSSTVTCPDGTVVSAGANSSAEASAIAEAAATEENEQFVVEGNGVTFAQFQVEFNQDVAVAEAAVSTAATSTSSTSAHCESTPTPVTPTPPNCTTTPTLPGCIPPVVVVRPPTISLAQQNEEGFNTGDGPVAQFANVVDPTDAAYPNGDPVDVVASLEGTTTDGGSVTQPTEVSSSPDPDGTHEDITYEFFYTAPLKVDVKVTEAVTVTDEAPGNGQSDMASTYFPISQPS